jgi:NADPH:quinone reductase
MEAKFYYNLILKKMKALVYRKKNTVKKFRIKLEEVPDPILNENDVLVSVKAFAVNPGDALFRRTQDPQKGGYRILGYDFGGVIQKIGEKVNGFAVGDRVYGVGDSARQGSYAEKVAVDYCSVAKIPPSVPFDHVAGAPIATMTAWESLFRDHDKLPEGVKNVLVLGAAGGVGTMAVQLLKARTDVQVIVTASRDESVEWLQQFNPDVILDHSQDAPEQLRRCGISGVDFVYAVKGLKEAITWLPKVIRPYGHLSIIEVDTGVDLWQFLGKSISIHLEYVFSKSAFDYKKESHGQILEEVISLVGAKKVKSPVKTVLKGLTVQNIFLAHSMLEQGHTIGKIVIELEESH